MTPSMRFAISLNAEAGSMQTRMDTLVTALWHRSPIRFLEMSVAPLLPCDADAPG